jgi:hypothetical protein
MKILTYDKVLVNSYFYFIISTYIVEINFEIKTEKKPERIWRFGNGRSVYWRILLV